MLLIQNPGGLLSVFIKRFELIAMRESVKVPGLLFTYIRGAPVEYFSNVISQFEL